MPHHYITPQQIVQDYLIQSLDAAELDSYHQYLAGDQKECLWIPKVEQARDMLLACDDLKCHICQAEIHINEHGRCYCLNQHESYDDVLANVDHLTARFIW